jgi:ligand-binding SRPBCC domain-containing protein
MIHTLERTQLIPAPIGRVWDYFSTPENLNALTPPEMHFEILGDPPAMYQGQLIAYRIRVAPGIRVHWLTEIRHVRENAFFVDEQRAGPYQLWYHEHHFTPAEGGVRMTDRVTYALPFGPLGDFMHALWVRRTLRRIFDYRNEAVARLFTPTA